MKKPVTIISTLLVAAALIWGGHFYSQNLRGAPPALPPPADLAAPIPAKPPPVGHNPIAADTASLPLKLPQDFTNSIFSSHVPGARILAVDPHGTHQEFCRHAIPAFIDLPAHSAPLGLAFFSKEWPRKFRYDLLGAYHGSWNRTVPTGHKLGRLKLDAGGNPEGVQDFITGWLTPHGVLGRSMDILFRHDKIIYISHDKAGVIYRVKYQLLS